MKLREFLVISVVLSVFIISGILFDRKYGNKEDTEIQAQNIVQGGINTYWDDQNNPQILPILLSSDAMTISQYIDFQIKQGNEIITQTSKYVGNGYNEPGTGIVATTSYQFDLPGGSYDVLCRLRIEVVADNLAVGTNPDDLVITNDRTFYGVYIENGQVIPANDTQFAVCDTENISYRNYLPVIIKH